ncbi:MAG: amino acid permease [Candidatus Omnitrophota bacterium]
MKRFNTFEGVFTPSLLSILGVIMYLRLGWVIGSVGLGWALVIICLANLITLSTALSLSSIVTNIRIGTGGAYSVITKSLGLEIGGAIGIPLYLSQAISVAFYVVGFTECWHSVFPYHNFFGVSLITWALILIISYTSAKLAFRIQYAIMALIGLSLVSIVLSPQSFTHNPVIWPSFQAGNFWMVFAIFFPAVTGFLAGATMSGELNDARRSIPRGTLSAVLVGFVIYIGLAIWLSRHVSANDLAANKSILIDLGRWKWAIIAGIMGATLSSAISMFVASPRTLLALGKHKTVPLSSSMARMNKKGEPTTAILFTALLSLITLLFGTLDNVAGLLTMFFLITYGMINLSVFIEQSIGLVSFRPSFRIPQLISFLGSAGCFVLMFFINAKFSLIAILTIVLIFWYLVKREMKTYSPDVRSGLLVFGAEQLAKMAAGLPYHPKIWKPNVLVSIKESDDLPEIMKFLKSVVLPNGRILAFQIIEKAKREKMFSMGVSSPKEREKAKIEREKIAARLTSITQPLKDEGLFVANMVIESADFITGTKAVIQSLRGTFFPPNTLFLTLTEDRKQDNMVEHVVRDAEDEGLGIIILLRHPAVGFGRQKVVNLWIRRQSPNLDLSILIALQLEKNWDGYTRIIQIVDNEQEKLEAMSYLDHLKELMRMSGDTQIKVMVGNFKEILGQVPPADMNIFGMPLEPDMAMIREISSKIQTSVLFLRDSEHEKATA